MEASAKAQRRRAHRKPPGLSVIRIEMKDAGGNQRHATADIVDVMEGGLGLAMTTPVNAGSIVVVRGQLAESHTADHVKAVVRWCRGKADGTFRAGLEVLDFASKYAPNRKHTNPVRSDALDCYEVMQLSPNADSDTISRLYRLLASRYHPDNLETGNSEMFLRLSEAYQILSDPAKRASYDLRRTDRIRLKTVSEVAKPASSHGVKPEARALDGWDAALRAGAGHETRSWTG